MDAAGNESAASNPVTFTTSASLRPIRKPRQRQPALQVNGTPTSSSVSLSWNAATDNVGVTGYRIYKGLRLPDPFPERSLNYTVTGLNPDTAYTFTVRAIDAAGNESANSNAVTATTGSRTGYSRTLGSKRGVHALEPS
ncbi:fibronectin type III domain-containing protein [Paenibacillus sp. JTLBN-2024]